MSIALSITLAFLILYTVVVGCTCSDASWSVQKYIQGDKISDDGQSNKERIYRTKLAAELMMGISIMVGVVAGFFLLWVLILQA